MESGMKALAPRAMGSACSSKAKACDDSQRQDHGSDDDIFFSFFHFLILLFLLHFLGDLAELEDIIRPTCKECFSNL